MGKNIKRILLMIFTVVILLLVPRNADTAYATELGGSGGTGGNGEGADGGQGTQVVTNGPKANKQFWLLYITDEYVVTRPEHGSLPLFS